MLTPSRQAIMRKKLRQQANILVETAHLLAVSSYTSFSKELPLIEKISPNDWDFFFTVAGIFIGASALAQSDIPDDDQDVLMEVVTEYAVAWSADSIRAFEDCKGMFEKSYDLLAARGEYREKKELVGADAVGSWIAWNLLRRAPETQHEWQLVRLTGISVTHAFADWWRTA